MSTNKMLTLHPPAFVETEGCTGPNYTRGQPSREESGVTMTMISDKYIPEFELPFRNVERYIKEIDNNWNRLDENQRNMIRKSIQSMKNVQEPKIEMFSSGSSDEIPEDVVYWVGKDPKNNVKKLLDSIWNNDNYVDEIKTETNNSIKKWAVDNLVMCKSNWPFLLIILVVALAIFAIFAACNNNN